MTAASPNTTESPGPRSWLARVDRDTLRQNMPILTLLVLVVLVGALSPNFLEVDTLVLLAADTATLFVMASGVTFAILLGSIDLSVQSAASLSSVIVALTLPKIGYMSFVLGFLAGVVMGFLNGAAHTRLRIPSFIATLASGGVWLGVAMLISNATPIQILIKDGDYLKWITGTTLGIPHEVIIGAIVLVVCLVIQRYTAFGRYISAIGSGEAATWASGIKVDRYKLLAFVMSGAMAGLTGVMLSGRLSSGSPRSADGFLLVAIASVIVGGTAITGGVGSVWRTLIGALIISVVRIGMTFIGVDIFAQQIVVGVMLILAVFLTIDRSKIPIVK